MLWAQIFGPPVCPTSVLLPSIVRGISLIVKSQCREIVECSRLAGGDIHYIPAAGGADNPTRISALDRQGRTPHLDLTTVQSF